MFFLFQLYFFEFEYFLFDLPRPLLFVFQPLPLSSPTEKHMPQQTKLMSDVL